MKATFRSLILILALAIVGCSTVQPKPIAELQVVKVAAVIDPTLPPPGIDHLGGAKYQKVMIQNHPKGWAGGIFLRTFGDARKTVRAMAASGKWSEIVVHLAAFDRSHAYPWEKLKRGVLADARWLEGLAKEFPKVTFMPSPLCEHNKRAKEMKKILDAVRKAAPSTLPVNSIWKGEVVYGYITEIHLENSKPRAPPKGEYTVSFDGFGGDGSGDFTDADIESILKRYPRARHIRLWNFRFNGKYGHKDTASIADRKHWPDANYIKGHVAMMKRREGRVTFPTKMLYKPFADDHGQGGKDNKAMFINANNLDSVRVFDSKGKEIDRMRRVPPDHNGEPKGRRFYSSKYAYQIAEIARKNTGSGLIRIERSPLTDGDLRSNRFR